jgi:hypothetical protein
MCVTRTKPNPLLTGKWVKNCWNASSAPAEPPIPTICEGRRLAFDGGEGARRLDGAEGGFLVRLRRTEVLLSDSRQCMKLKASERRRTLALWRGILQGGGYVLTDGCCRRGALANGRLDGRDLRGTVTARPFVSASKTNAICRSDKWAAT